jgi:hypothetical protein
LVLVRDTQWRVRRRIALMVTILIIRMPVRPTDITGQTGSWAEFLSARVPGSMAGTDGLGMAAATTARGSIGDAIMHTVGDTRTDADMIIADISMGWAEATADAHMRVDMLADSMVVAPFTEAVVFTEGADKHRG